MFLNARDDGRHSIVEAVISTHLGVKIMVSTVSDDAHAKKKPETCRFILPQKERRCRMPVKAGEELCVAHSTSLPTCPECGTRLPSEAALRKHLLTPLCPSVKRRLRVEAEPYFIKDVNVPKPTTATFLSSDESTATPVAKSEDAKNNVLRLIKRLRPLLSAPLIEASNGSLPEASIVHSAWSDKRDSSVKMEAKHFPQIASLAALVLNSAPIISHPSDIAIVDLAAGRAYLALYLGHILWLRGIPARLVVVDRVSTRLKADRSIRAWTEIGRLASFRRLTIDLRHLNLSGLDELLSAADVRFVGKHMCGAALDLALTAVSNFARENSRSPGSVSFVFASCCRKLCNRAMFGDGGDIWQRLNVTNHDLNQLCTSSYWGLDSSHSDDMANIGRKCRYLVDSGRVEWLNSVGWNARVGTYTEVSPENACIVATWIGIQTNSEPKILTT